MCILIIGVSRVLHGHALLHFGAFGLFPRTIDVCGSDRHTDTQRADTRSVHLDIPLVEILTRAYVLTVPDRHVTFITVN